MHIIVWVKGLDEDGILMACFVFSQNLYKSDLEWLKGIGWSPLGSLEAEKNKRASEIISEKKYRQPPDRNKFTSIPDAMDIVLAKTNAKNRSDVSTSSEIKETILPDTQ